MATLYNQHGVFIEVQPNNPKLRFTVTYNKMYFEVSFTPKSINNEIVEKWINALRSGKYKQGNHFLYSSEKETYCCLGVLANVCDLGLTLYEYRALLENNWFLEHSFNVIEEEKDLQLFFSRMNDAYVPFNVIAIVIEQLATLFNIGEANEH